MRGSIKKILAIIGGMVVIFVAVAAIFLGIFIYETKFKITAVGTIDSPDGEYKLTIEQIGETVLYGPANGRFVLKHGLNTVTKHYFTVYDDGGSINEYIWELDWHEDCVEVVIDASEQSPMMYTLNFDGTVNEEK